MILIGVNAGDNFYKSLKNSKLRKKYTGEYRLYQSKGNNMKPFDKIILKTERLLIRPLIESDADSIFSIYSDSETMRYWNTEPWDDCSKSKELTPALHKIL